MLKINLNFILEKIQHLLKKYKKRLASVQKKDIIVALLFERATKQALRAIKPLTNKILFY
jgi:hypothetical protein